jgi:hypothetical protein
VADGTETYGKISAAAGLPSLADSAEVKPRAQD